MSEPRFFTKPQPVTLADIAASTGAELHGDGSRVVTGVAAIERAGASDLAYFNDAAYADAFRASRAAGCVVSPKFSADAPADLALLVADDPYRVFAQAAAKLFPSAMRPSAIFEDEGVAPGAYVHPDARLEAGVDVDPGAVIGARAEIGAGTVIAANAVIGPDVRIGRDCAIGPGATVVHALIGNRVIVHSGACIGQDGFGFAMGRKGHLKVPQIGRVVIQDDVEIGASTCIDRGSSRDTIVGEGSKIDNLVQIAHNVIIGRHCVIVSQVGISGSVKIGDFVVIGGQAGTVGHIEIGDGAEIAARGGVTRDVPARARWAGFPAQPMRNWLREMAALRKFARGGKENGDGED